MRTGDETRERKGIGEAEIHVKDSNHYWSIPRYGRGNSRAVINGRFFVILNYAGQEAEAAAVADKINAAGARAKNVKADSVAQPK